MVEFEQQRNSNCLKIPKGLPPTDAEIGNQIGLLNDENKPAAQTAWGAYKRLRKNNPPEAIVKLLAYINSQNRQGPCLSGNQLTDEAARKLFSLAVRNVAKIEAADARSSLSEGVEKLIQTIRRPKPD